MSSIDAIEEKKGFIHFWSDVMAMSLGIRADGLLLLLLIPSQVLPGRKG
jgi:hypothetical protein